MSVKKKKSYTCGVFTSWTPIRVINGQKILTLHYAVNRFVGDDLIHYDLPANNNNKNNKDRISLYIDLEVVNNPVNNESLCNFEFKDQRFNNLAHKNSEYVLELSYTTKGVALYNREKEGKVVNCYYFSMPSESIINISKEGYYLWTEDENNTKKIVDINEGVKLISDNIVQIPEHIKSRTVGIVI